MNDHSSPVAYHLGRFPPTNVDWQRLLPLLGPAHAAIARYEGLLHAVPNPNVLLSPLSVQEAVLSSRIEGTQATLGEVLEFEAEGPSSEESATKIADIKEVLNYREALHEATRLMAELPLSQRLIKEVHAVLMRGVRGQNKAPGEYRRVANWIGPAGQGIERARFIPCGAEHVPDAMSAWEKYLNGTEPDLLVQLAVAHAEFEAIHPFLDGNGRLGRLLVPLFLFGKGCLTNPNFYVSEFLEAHREEYYDRLLAVSRTGDWTGWCEFFLHALIAQAKSNVTKAEDILNLYKIKKDWITAATKSQYAVKALDAMFARPIFRTSDFVAAAGIPSPTANRILRIVKKKGLLKELRAASGQRAAVLVFSELLNVAEGRDVF